MLRQQQGFVSVMPSGHNAFGSQFERVLPASSVANLYPFNYSGKTDPQGFYIGKDKYGANVIVDFDKRDDDKTSATLLILGTSGQGKSYLMKLLPLNLLDAGKSARTFSCGDDDRALVETCDLLSLKPIIYAANMDEAGFADYENDRYFRLVRDLAQKEGAQVLPICAKLEQDIAELEGEDRQMFLDELGIAESGLDRLIKCSYSLLGLISFLTYGKDECRAWTIKKGTKAPQAAGKIHTDIERGFIRAEVIAYDDMIKYGGVNAAKEKGQLRSEGKEYVVQDGDMIYFRFNV